MGGAGIAHDVVALNFRERGSRSSLCLRCFVFISYNFAWSHTRPSCTALQDGVVRGRCLVLVLLMLTLSHSPFTPTGHARSEEPRHGSCNTTIERGALHTTTKARSCCLLNAKGLPPRLQPPQGLGLEPEGECCAPAYRITLLHPTHPQCHRMNLYAPHAPRLAMSVSTSLHMSHAI